ncbi:hypothetical protein ACLK2D_16385 [Escherichia coli]
MFDSTLNPLWQRYILAVQEEVKPALGCTEPISLALAAAVAAAELEGPVERVEAWVSPNLMKNGLGVTVPGTGMVGLPIAAALGALGGNANAGLEVLKDATAQAIADAKALLAAGKVSVKIRNLAMKSSSHAPKSGTVRSGRYHHCRRAYQHCAYRDAQWCRVYPAGVCDRGRARVAADGAFQDDAG